MQLSQSKNIIGIAATAAVLSYSYLGKPTENYIDFLNYDIPYEAPQEMNFDSYQDIGNEQGKALEQINIIHRFASNILDNIKDLEPEFSKTVDENFWDMI